MLVNFQVTDKIIDESKGGCSKRCVVANMVNEVLASPYSSGVCSNTTNIYRQELFQSQVVRRIMGCVSNPPEVDQFIIHFDTYKSQDENGTVPMFRYVDGNIKEIGRQQGPGRPPCISFQLDIHECYLKPEVVTAIKESGYNEAVAIVNECASVGESVATLPLKLAHAR